MSLKIDDTCLITRLYEIITNLRNGIICMDVWVYAWSKR